MERPITWEQIKRANELGLVDHVVIHNVGLFADNGDAHGVSMDPSDARWSDDEDFIEEFGNPEDYEDGDLLVFDCRHISQACNNFINEYSDFFDMEEIFFDDKGVDKDDLKYIFVEDMKESRSLHGRMLKEEDERVSLDFSRSDKWSRDGKNYMELEVKKNGKNTPINVCVVFTDEGEHLDTVFFKLFTSITENEAAEELDVSVGDIKKLVEKAKIKAMKEFE